MNSHYSELKDLPQLRGSLNTIVSIKTNKTNRSLRRPPSLSESYAWNPDNIERLHYVQQKEAARAELPEPTLILSEPVIVSQYLPNTETRILNFVLRLLFHISLISIFESLFFFLYVSTLEDTGILNVIGGFIQSATNSCMNLTAPDKSFINTIFTYFVNVSQVDENGSLALETRNISNQRLMSISWYYVGGCCGLFVATTSYAKCRRITIYWRKIIGENAAMILLLAAYEYMFFTTIIKPYTPITGNEIAQRTIHQLNASCGLF
jgi:hypothetical protein